MDSRHLSIPEISKKIGLHRSTVHRLVVTLESAGWLHKIPDTEKFALGLKALALSGVADDEISSQQIVRPFMETLAALSGETVALCMSDGISATCVDKVESFQTLKISANVGQDFPFHAGATGFAVLLGMPPEQAKRILERAPLKQYTEQTETDPARVFEKYLKARKDGFIVTRGTVDAGVTAIAAPLYFPRERSYGSVSLIMPENRATEAVVAKYIKKLCETVEEIRHRVGAPKPIK